MDTIKISLIEAFENLEENEDFKVYIDDLIDDDHYVGSKGEENFVRVIDEHGRKFWITLDLVQEKSDMVL